MKVYIKIRHKSLGDFDGEHIECDPEEYKALIEVSKNFYMENIYEGKLQDGTYLIIGGKIIQECVYMICRVED